MPKNCPLCGASFQGPEIPEESREFFGAETHFSTLLGVEVRGVYDGVLYWVDEANCGQAFSRDFGCATRNKRSKVYAAKYNHPSGQKS